MDEWGSVLDVGMGVGEWLPGGCGGGGSCPTVWGVVGLPAPATRLWEGSRETGGLFSWGGGGVKSAAVVVDWVFAWWLLGVDAQHGLYGAFNNYSVESTQYNHSGRSSPPPNPLLPLFFV